MIGLAGGEEPLMVKCNATWQWHLRMPGSDARDLRERCPVGEGAGERRVSKPVVSLRVGTSVELGMQGETTPKISSGRLVRM